MYNIIAKVEHDSKEVTLLPGDSSAFWRSAQVPDRCKKLEGDPHLSGEAAAQGILLTESSPFFSCCFNATLLYRASVSIWLVSVIFFVYNGIIIVTSSIRAPTLSLNAAPLFLTVSAALVFARVCGSK